MNDNQSIESLSWQFTFMDLRLPQEIQAALERAVMAPFISDESGKLLRYHADASNMGISYKLTLCFEAALQISNFYRFDCTASWPHLTTTHSDVNRKSSMSWFEFWTSDFELFTASEPVDSVPTLYDLRRDSALQNESQLQSITNIQTAIVAAMKQGATFSTCHKEGGTILSWRSGRYVRSDYGDSPCADTL